MFIPKKFLSILHAPKLNRALLAAASLILLTHGLSSFALSEPDNSLQKTREIGLYDSFAPRGDIRRFAGETLFFDISFLWFKDAATAQVGIYWKNGQYYAVLQAQTKGFIGFFTNYRQHIYEAHFDVLEGGKRLRANKFIRRVRIGDDEESSRHFFDYSTRTHHWYEYQNEEVVESGREEIPEGRNFDDVLTTFYNFRNGVYGPLKRGSNYKVYTIPEKGHDQITVNILSEEEEKIQSGLEGREPSEDWLIDIIVPKEVFITESGELRFWSSKHFIPLETTVKDYILLGDLRAKLTHREFHENDQAQLSISSLSTPEDKAGRANSSNVINR